MSCVDYNNFYMTLPIALLTIVSIAGIYLIYLWRQYNSQLRNLQSSITGFKVKMSRFVDLTTNVVPWIHMPVRPRATPSSFENRVEVTLLSLY